MGKKRAIKQFLKELRFRFRGASYKFTFFLKLSVDDELSTEERKSIIFELYKKGRPIEEIAKNAKCSVSTVRRWIWLKGLKRKNLGAG